jgi:hypothetical protein
MYNTHKMYLKIVKHVISLGWNIEVSIILDLSNEF